MPARHVLRDLGRRVRALREERGLSQERLARRAALSLRYLSQVESGRGNISVLRLFALARALTVPAADLLRPGSSGGRPVLALIGLRGAGKSTIGKKVARSLKVPFWELDRLIEREAGLGLGEVFALHGETYYRRLEATVLSRVLSSGEPGVLATGGSLPTDPGSFDMLKRGAVTVWLKARPEEHLERVAAQGDRRPMAGRADPLAELRTLLKAREPLYAQAEHSVDTSRLGPDGVARAILRLARGTTGLG